MLAILLATTPAAAPGARCDAKPFTLAKPAAAAAPALPKDVTAPAPQKVERKPARPARKAKAKSPIGCKTASKK